MEIVKEKDLQRYAVIDVFDIILFDSSSLRECWDVYLLFGNECCRGIYDYLQDSYIDLAYIVDMI